MVLKVVTTLLKVISANKIVFESTTMLNPTEGLTIVVQWPKGVVHEPSQSERITYFLKDNSSGCSWIDRDNISDSLLRSYLV